MTLRPRRRGRAEANIERNQSDGRKFVRVKIWEAHPVHGPEVKVEHAIDEGTAFQLYERLRACLAQLDNERSH
jgi:hypothetical protein